MMDNTTIAEMEKRFADGFDCPSGLRDLSYAPWVLPIKLIDTGANVCHWPLWQENGAPDFLVCGADGYPYCAKHRRVATSTPRSLASLTSLGG